MVFTNFGRQAVAWRLGSSLPDLYIKSVGIGVGSGAASVTDSELVSGINRTDITGSPNFTENFIASFQGDFNSFQMSGVSLTEFALFDTGSETGFPGSAWQRESFGNISFDGTNELQVRSILQVIQSGTA